MFKFKIDGIFLDGLLINILFSIVVLGLFIFCIGLPGVIHWVDIFFSYWGNKVLFWLDPSVEYPLGIKTVRWGPLPTGKEFFGTVQVWWTQTYQSSSEDWYQWVHNPVFSRPKLKRLAWVWLFFLGLIGLSFNLVRETVKPEFPLVCFTLLICAVYLLGLFTTYRIMVVVSTVSILIGLALGVIEFLKYGKTERWFP